ncbi:MAG: hypothetical protein B7Y80_10175 [Hyphomicrobium sp. 32-62-53]|nr:MAG: hypothetical protein B7Z29_08555 [Hyphomicrobium sp. 12-62-95]OYX99930.1 MAG: hypothetical protein B7Y80_10175 [Hyphomicrobium sp. 32-62-53]
MAPNTRAKWDVTIGGLGHETTAVLLNDTVHDRHHGCTLVGRTIDRLAAANGIQIIGRSPVHHDWRSHQKLLKVMETADLILINAEGTIHHDRPAGRLLLEAGAWAKERGIPSALINMTWEKNSAQSAKLLQAFSLVAVREGASYRELVAHGYSPLQAPDLALYSAPTEPQPRSGIGVTDSVLPGVSADLESLRHRFGGRHISILYGRRGPRECARAVRKFGGLASFSPSQTLRAATAAISERRSQTSSADEFVNKVSSCRLLITGRFHAVIVALATQTPVLAVASNTHKIEATLRDAGLDEVRISQPEDIDAEAIKHSTQWSETEVQNLKAYLARGRRQIETLFGTVKEISKQRR